MKPCVPSFEANSEQLIRKSKHEQENPQVQNEVPRGGVL